MEGGGDPGEAGEGRGLRERQARSGLGLGGQASQGEYGLVPAVLSRCQGSAWGGLMGHLSETRKPQNLSLGEGKDVRERGSPKLLQGAKSAPGMAAPKSQGLWRGGVPNSLLPGQRLPGPAPPSAPPSDPWFREPGSRGAKWTRQGPAELAVGTSGSPGCHRGGAKRREAQFPLDRDRCPTSCSGCPEAQTPPSPGLGLHTPLTWEVVATKTAFTSGPGESQPQPQLPQLVAECFVSRNSRSCCKARPPSRPYTHTDIPPFAPPKCVLVALTDPKGSPS